MSLLILLPLGFAWFTAFRVSAGLKNTSASVIFRKGETAPVKGKLIFQLSRYVIILADDNSLIAIPQTEVQINQTPWTVLHVGGTPTAGSAPPTTTATPSPTASPSTSPAISVPPTTTATPSPTASPSTSPAISVPPATTATPSPTAATPKQMLPVIRRPTRPRLRYLSDVQTATTSGADAPGSCSVSRQDRMSCKSALHSLDFLPCKFASVKPPEFKGANAQILRFSMSESTGRYS
jgi:hypothetical protein